MKLITMKSLLAGTAMVLFSTAVFAQGTEMRFSVPFAFTAGERHLPPGDYIVRWDAVFGTIALELRNVDALLLPPGIPATPSSDNGRSSLRFNQYGNRYFLSSVERGGLSKREWLPSRAECEAASGERRHVAAVYR